MNWHKYNIKDSTTYPDKDKYLIVKMNTGEHWTGCYCGDGYWIIYRIDEPCYSINYNKYDDISSLHEWEIICKWAYIDDISEN